MASTNGMLIAQAWVSHREEEPLDHHIVKLARNVRKDPNDQPAVLALIHALRSRGELSTMAALLECWASVSEGGSKPELAVAGLYCQLAVGRDAAASRKLARAALDLAPSCMEALLLFEQHAQAADRDELCNRYLAFLEHAPFHPSSPRLRVTLIDKLVEAGRYDEAMGQVKVLPPSSSLPPATRDIERACLIPPMPPLQVA